MMLKKTIVKASLFTLIMALIVIGTIAVAAVTEKGDGLNAEKATVNITWYFHGGDPESAQSYSTSPLPNKPCDNQQEVICQITAPAELTNPSLPDMSADVPGTDQDVLEQIKEAVDDLTHNETVTSFRSE